MARATKAKRTTKATKANERAVVVCTDKRGVFFGYTDKPFNREQMVLKRCRMCVYWDSKGVLGLAVNGPGPKCRVTPAVLEQTLVDIHSQTLCTDVAIKCWESEPWG